MSELSKKRWFRGLLVLVIGFVGLMLVAPMLAAAWLQRSGRERVVALLEERFDAVALESLEIRGAPGLTFLPQLSARGRGLAVSLPDETDHGPFISIGSFNVDLSVVGLLRRPIRIRSLVMDELLIQIPPGDGEDDPSENAGGQPRIPPAFAIETLLADGTVLRILHENPQKTPMQFDLHELTVRSAGIGEPMEFESMLRNAKPPGDIETKGTFGPLNLRDAGASPVAGHYVFENADLSDFGGIAGTLYSEGRFDGVLGRIHVEGYTETPDFQLVSAGNPVSLTTTFEATVDGTSGDTLLHPVEALLGTSRFRTRGGVVKEPGDAGKTVCLSAEDAKGRIEDFMRLTMKRAPPVMEGEIHFASLIVIPPGDVDVSRKLALDGGFSIESATFPEREVQEKVDGLSEAGRGADALVEERVFSDIRGRFLLRDGVMTLSSLSFTVPGAQVNLEGTYGLVTEELDFHGELRLDAALSETTSGIKSFFLKLLDPLFGRDDAGAVVPIKITGTPEEPSFGVEAGRILTREVVASPPASAVGKRIWPAPGESCTALEHVDAVPDKSRPNPPAAPRGWNAPP